MDPAVYERERVRALRLRGMGTRGGGHFTLINGVDVRKMSVRVCSKIIK
jgi:hypothetical protein